MSIPAEETPYLALVVLKVADLAGPRMAWRNPPPALVVPVVPGVTSKGAFVRAIVGQAAGASKAPDHIINMPRGLGSNGLPLETVVTSTAKNVQIVWTMAAYPPPGFGKGGNSSTLPSTNPFFEKGGASSTEFQAVTSLVDLSDAQFYDCVRKMQSREANRGREDYFVMEMKYDYVEQKQKQREKEKLVAEDDEFMPLPPIAMSTTREDFFSPEKKKRFEPPLPLFHHPHSKQYEEEEKDLRMLTAASSSGLMGPSSPSNYDIIYPPSRQKTRYLPTVEEEPEDDDQFERIADEDEAETSLRTTKINKEKSVAAPHPVPLPKTPNGSPRHRRRHGLKVPAPIKGQRSSELKSEPTSTPFSSPKINDTDSRPETYTPDVWGINKTILDARIAAHEKETSPDKEILQRRRSPTRGSSSKSRIPVLPFHLPLPRGLKKSASSPSLMNDYKKGGSSSSPSQHQ